eukprot:scaffold25563_cov65-Phaeocystis_antarctica.AAC.2
MQQAFIDKAVHAPFSRARFDHGRGSRGGRPTADGQQEAGAPNTSALAEADGTGTTPPAGQALLTTPPELNLSRGRVAGAARGAGE